MTKFSKEADEDLKKIYVYSLENFGLKQARKYKTDLGMQFLALCNNPEMGVTYDHIKRSLRRYVYHSHSIYYQIKDNYILIVRVLGNRQDPVRHF